VDRPGQIGPAEGWDRAEAAPPVTARSEFQRRHRAVTDPTPQHGRTGGGSTLDRVQLGMSGDLWPFSNLLARDRADRQQRATVTRLVGGVLLTVDDRLQFAGNGGIVVETEDRIRLGETVGELGAVPFGHAADSDDCLGLAVL